MNSRLEAQRARQNRAIALFLTFLFHIALFAGIYYYNSGNSEVEKDKTEQSVQTRDEVPAKQVSTTKP